MLVGPKKFCPSEKSNQQPSDQKVNVLTTTLPPHTWMKCNNINLWHTLSKIHLRTSDSELTRKCFWCGSPRLHTSGIPLWLRLWLCCSFVVSNRKPTLHRRFKYFVMMLFIFLQKKEVPYNEQMLLRLSQMKDMWIQMVPSLWYIRVMMICGYNHQVSKPRNCQILQVCQIGSLLKKWCQDRELPLIFDIKKATW